MRYLVQRAAAWYTLVALAVAGQLGDVVTTAQALRAGDMEANPLAAQLFHLYGYATIAGVKMACMLALILLLGPFLLTPAARRTPYALLALLFLMALVAESCFVVGHNLAYLLVLAR